MARFTQAAARNKRSFVEADRQRPAFAERDVDYYFEDLVDQDERFQAAMRRAIGEGRERPPARR